jgi:hypothetical protein
MPRRSRSHITRVLRKVCDRKFGNRPGSEGLWQRAASGYQRKESLTTLGREADTLHSRTAFRFAGGAEVALPL